MSERKRSRVWYWVGGGLLAAVLLVAGSIFGLWMLVLSAFSDTRPGDPVPSTQTGYTTHVRNGQVDFDLVYGRETTGINSFLLSDSTGKRIWELTGGGEAKPAKVVYGQVPAGWKQVFPVGDENLPDIRGTKVKVRIDTRFHVAFGPGVEVNEGEVDVPK